MRLGATIRVSAAALSLLLVTGMSRAQEPSAADVFRKAQDEDRRFDLESARADYARALEMNPAGTFAKQATTRWAVLAPLDAKELVLLSDLERARSVPDPGLAAVDALEARARGASSSSLAVEALLFVGEARLRAGEADLARRAFEAARARANDRFSSALALARLYEVALRTEDRALADRVAADPLVDPELRGRHRSAARRRAAKVVAGSILLLFVVVSTLSTAWKRPKRGHAFGAALFAMAWIGIGGIMASFYEAGTHRPFVLFGLAALPLLLLSRSAALALPRLRIPLAALSGLAIFSAALLALDRVDPAYLRGFGL